MGEHVRAIPCPECGKFSSHSWSTEWLYSPSGDNQYWGGTCKEHGSWMESAA
jgi:hypothetical protein